jgi:protein involved in polysaccharide export with SLBB domain
MAGDDLKLSVNEDGSYDGVYKVRRGGDIIVPAVGRVHVAGKTVEDAQAGVRDALEAAQLAHATVTLKKVKDPGVEPLPSSSNPGQSSAPSAGIIYVTGLVANPCALSLKPGENLGAYAAILKAGGATQYHSERVYVLCHPPNRSPVILQINMRTIAQGNAPDFPLHDKDIVVVPDTFDGFPRPTL